LFSWLNLACDFNFSAGHRARAGVLIFVCIGNPNLCDRKQIGAAPEVKHARARIVTQATQPRGTPLTFGDIRPKWRFAVSASRSLAVNGVNPASSNLAAAKAALLRPGAFAATAHRERVHKILQVLESTTPCSIHDLAVELKLSHSRLEHWFKQQTGVCLGHLLTEQRLRRAADLLTNSYMSVKEVASAVGYQHESSFVRAFGHRFAQSPGCYRRQCWNQKRA
jgi:AraC-like DNA-binding protein